MQLNLMCVHTLEMSVNIMYAGLPYAGALTSALHLSSSYRY